MIVPALVMRAIIRREDHESIVVDIKFPQKRKQPAHIVIHHRNHRRKALFRIRPLLVLVDAIVGNFLTVTGHTARFVVGMRDRPMHVEQKWILLIFADELKRPVDHEMVRIGDLPNRNPASCLRIITDYISRKFDLGFVLPEKSGIEIVSIRLVHVTKPIVEAVLIRMTGIVDFFRCFDMPERPFPHASCRIASFL